VAVFPIDRARTGGIYHLNPRFAFWLTSALVVFLFAGGGCERNKEPVSVLTAPTAQAPAGTEDVASSPVGKTKPADSAPGST
jgi:hypothetical protein